MPRFFARIGVEHPGSVSEGQSTGREVIFHSLVAYRESARVAYDLFRKYDVVIAQGRTRINPHTGKERFEAEHIGHSALRTRYEVDRSTRTSTAPESSMVDAHSRGPVMAGPQGLGR